MKKTFNHLTEFCNNSLSLSLSLSAEAFKNFLLPISFFLMIAYPVTSHSQGSFGLEFEVLQPDGGVIFDCTCIPLTFTLTNPEDEPNTITSLDLQTLIGRYEFCDNPGFVLQPASGYNAQIGTVDVWRMSNITLQPFSSESPPKSQHPKSSLK